MAFKANKIRTPKTGLFPAMMMVGIFAFFGISCLGGGGDEDSGPPPPSSLSYTGITDQAPLTDSNAQEMVGRAIAGGQLGSGFENITSDYDSGTSGSGDYTAYRTYRTMESAMFQIEFPTQKSYYGPAVAYNDTIPGFICGSEGGGNAQFSIDYDETTRVFQGSMTFNAYCVDRIEISGNTTFSGVVDLSDPNEPEIVQFELTFGVMAISDYSLDEDAFIEGTFSYDGRSVQDVIIMNLIVQDSEGLTYRVENYVWLITEGSSTETITMSGRFYHPNYGYVQISTGITFEYINGTDWPYDGYIIFEGASNTVIHLIAENPNECRIIADTDGDGQLDDLDETIDWEDLII